MNYKLRTNKAFTLIELVVAVAILAMVLSFAGVIFKVSIGAYRTAIANAEIMRKLRAITDQLNTDFEGLRKDGYLILRLDVRERREYQDSIQESFRADRIYYFSTGDFQSWFDTNIRSIIARVYFGHDSISLNPELDRPVSQWNLARDMELITPGNFATPDCNGLSFAEFKANVSGTEANANNLLASGVPIDIYDPNTVRRLMCQNAGEIIIEWSNGTIWSPGPKFCTALTAKQDWPKALKFTFTLYDSMGIIEDGRRFTHIVYIGE